MSAEWRCKKCGGEAFEHSIASSMCVWEPVLRPRMLAPDEDPREWDGEAWALCTENCPEGCMADHRGEQ